MHPPEVPSRTHPRTSMPAGTPLTATPIVTGHTRVPSLHPVAPCTHGAHHPGGGGGSPALAPVASAQHTHVGSLLRELQGSVSSVCGLSPRTHCDRPPPPSDRVGPCPHLLSITSGFGPSPPLLSLPLSARLHFCPWLCLCLPPLLLPCPLSSPPLWVMEPGHERSQDPPSCSRPGRSYIRHRPRRHQGMGGGRGGGWAGGLSSRNHTEVPCARRRGCRSSRARAGQQARVDGWESGGSTIAGCAPSLPRAVGSQPLRGSRMEWEPCGPQGLQNFSGGGKTVASERGPQGGGSDWREAWGAGVGVWGLVCCPH